MKSISYGINHMDAPYTTAVVLLHIIHTYIHAYHTWSVARSSSSKTLLQVTILCVLHCRTQPHQHQLLISIHSQASITRHTPAPRTTNNKQAVNMPTAGFPAFFEVAAETFGLTVASIVGSRYALLCLRESSSLNVSGLAACLLAAFCCLYGE